MLDGADIERAEELLVDALIVDGEEAKQWYLEKILEALVGTEQMEELRDEHEWEKGTAP